MNSWRIDIDFSSSIDPLELIGKYVRFSFLNETVTGKVADITVDYTEDFPDRVSCLLIGCHIGSILKAIELTLTSGFTMTGRVYE